MLLTSCRAMPREPGRWRHAAVRCAIGAWLAAIGSSLAGLPALAQTTPSPSEAAPSGRAKRDADKVFHWILIQGDRTRKAPTGAAKDTKDAKEIKDAKDDRPVAKPARVAAHEAAPVRPKAEAVAAAESVNARPAGKPAERSATPLAKTAAPATAVDASNAARLARVELAPEVGATSAPAIEVSDEAPQGLVPLAQPAPQFPPSAMRNLRRGTVQVQFSVLTDGSVANLEVLKTTNARLNAAALEAIGQWRFQPVSKVQTGAVEVGFDLD